VLELAEIKRYSSAKNTQTKAYWLCICECGNRKIIRGEHLTSGRTVSCGCSYFDINIKHGHSRRGKKTPTYNTWASMNGRINSPDQLHKKYYQGIGIDERWNNYENFLEDMGERPSLEHSIDRIDPFLPYCKENCRWATRSEQMQNTKRHYEI